MDIRENTSRVIWNIRTATTDQTAMERIIRLHF